MKQIILSLVLGAGIQGAPLLAAPANHVDMTHAILDFLSRTELCLNSCRDAETLQAAIPLLLQLKQECAQLAEDQRNLPEPTNQDYIAAQSKIEAFNTLWNAIRNHIERMEQEQILTQEVRQILHIAPVPAQN